MWNDNESRAIEAPDKICSQCGEAKPLTDFLRRSGKRAGAARRRGTCRTCRQQAREGEGAGEATSMAAAVGAGDVARAARPDTTDGVGGAAGAGAVRAGVGGAAKSVVSAAARTGMEAGASEAPEPAASTGGAAGADAGEAAGARAAGAEAQPGADADAAAGEPPRRKRKRRRRRSKRKGAGAAPTGGEAASRPGAGAASAPDAPAKRLPAPLVAAAPKTLRQAQLHAAITRIVQPGDVSGLRPTKLGFIRMRGKTDNGRKWYQEVEPELAFTLVRERAAVVVNRHTVRRLYSNKEFRRLILERDNYTCHFCGQYGDTIDHLLPRAKGGHTTPVNCVCACNECNQSKADRDLLEFMGLQE